MEQTRMAELGGPNALNVMNAITELATDAARRFKAGETLFTKERESLPAFGF